MSEPQFWADGTLGVGIGATVWNERTLMVLDWAGGRLLAFAAEDGHVEPWGDGYSSPESLVIHDDVAWITERTGALLEQDLLTPGRASARVVAAGLGSLHQVVRVDASTAEVVDYAGGRILSVDIPSGAATVVASGLSQPIGLAIAADGTRYVTEQAPGRLLALRPDGGRDAVVLGLVAPFLLSWADDSATTLLVTERDPANRVALVDVTQPAPQLIRLVGAGITQPSQAVTMGRLLCVTGNQRVLAADASGGLRPGVSLDLPSEAMWPASWYDAEIDTGVSGYVAADLEVVVDPPGIADISDHPAAGADPAHPTVRILAGAGYGSTDVVVRERATGAELARRAVRVGIPDASPLDGPPQWIGEGQPVSGGLTLLDLDLSPGVRDEGARTPRDGSTVLSQWRVTAVLVDTGSAVWPTNTIPPNMAPTVSDAKATWRSVLTGPGSVDAFYRELSAGRLGVDLHTGAVLDPVHLGGTWTDWFDKNAGGQWVAKQGTFDKVIASLTTAKVDLSATDAVLLIVRSPSATQFAWPWGHGKNQARKYKVKDGAGKDVERAIGDITMCHDQTTAAGLGFTNVEVTSHELGHTLGLDDQYMGSGFSDAMARRDLSSRELMALETALPHLCARHKLLLGFLDPGHVKSYVYGTAVDETVTLSALATGLPSAGTFAAVELRVAPKVSWFFEFRRGTGGIGDTGAVFGGGLIVGYDAWRYADPPIAADARRLIVLVNPDEENDGPTLTAGTTYNVIDTNDPNALVAFSIEVVSIGATSATVRVKLAPVSQPDPALRNNLGEKGDYKSPDIQVRNELSDKDSAWLNRPLLGKKNRVVATVHNIGGLPAPNVSVRFKVLPFNTDHPESERWQDLGGPIKHDVPAGGAVEFETTWVPPEDRHFCVQARIDRYTRVPGAKADEPDVDNNLAQSNYFKIESAPSSPASREMSVVDVHNPFGYPVSASITLRQDSTRYRSYVDHRWVHLEAGETRQVRVEVESRARSIWDAIEAHWPDGRTWVNSWIDLTRSTTSGTGTGVTLDVATRVRTRIEPVAERLGPGRSLVRVTSTAAGAPSPNDGTVTMQVLDDTGETAEVVAARVGNDGLATLEFTPGYHLGIVRYSGHQGWGSSEPTELDLHR